MLGMSPKLFFLHFTLVFDLSTRMLAATLRWINSSLSLCVDYFRNSLLHQ